VLVLHAREEIARVGKGRHPAPVLEPRVPAHVVGMHVGAHHVVHALRSHSRRLQPFQKWVLLPVPVGARHALLVVADAGVDDHGVSARLDHPRVHAEHEGAALGQVVAGGEPGEMRPHHLGIEGGEEPLRGEARIHGLLDAGEPRVADHQSIHARLLSPVLGLDAVRATLRPDSSGNPERGVARAILARPHPERGGDERGHGNRVRAATAIVRRHAGRSGAGHAGRRDAPALLASRGRVRRGDHATAADPGTRRGPHPFPRRPGPPRPAVPSLLSPRYHALLRQGRGLGHPLLLPRLALRRGGALPRHAV